MGRPGSPGWSPDSRWVAFDAAQSGNIHIFVIGADGGAPRRLTQGSANNVRPSWSGDGKWIYFSSNRTGEWQIWKAPSGGGDAIQVTKRSGFQACESPDGKLLLYSKYQEPGIWSVPVEGGEETRVLEKGGLSIWGVAKDGICFFDWKDALHPLMQFYNFRDRHTTTLHEFPRGTSLDIGSSAITVSPDERWILYTQIDQAGSNLTLVENFR